MIFNFKGNDKEGGAEVEAALETTLATHEPIWLSPEAGARAEPGNVELTFQPKGDKGNSIKLQATGLGEKKLAGTVGGKGRTGSR